MAASCSSTRRPNSGSSWSSERGPAVDAVLFTHEHADHVNGIDDLRIFSRPHAARLPVYGPPETLEMLESAFRYIFDPG